MPPEPFTLPLVPTLNTEDVGAVLFQIVLPVLPVPVSFSQSHLVAPSVLEYTNQSARISMHARGIESLFITDEEVDPSYYYLYEDLATEAFRRAKIEPLAGAIHDANSKPNLNAMMTGALVRRGLIKDGDKFSFELTNNFASINNTNVKSDVHKDLLQVYQSAFGSSLPRGGRFIIGKQQ